MTNNGHPREEVDMALRQDSEVKALSRRQLRAILDERARRYLGMTAKEFLDALAKDELPDTPAVAHLKMLVGEEA